ncbi:TonB-dependent receptor, partial [bacterium]|nr:TonB-dependent receptor [bacterium]
IADALRLAPGIYVARIDSNKWAVSARGFNDRFSNKLLVMIDGRSVYTSMFSGVYWDMQDLILDDIDRIEVVRGPGAALWGANAVNGVINIITKKASETKGGLLSVMAGTEDQNITQFRYGGSLGDEADYRLYGKYFDRDHFTLSNGDPADDEWDGGRMGFRVDWTPSDQDEVMFQGDLYSGESKTGEQLPVYFPPYLDPFLGDDDYSGGYILANWERQLDETSDMSLQTYYHHDHRDNSYADITRHTFDIDFQHNFLLCDWQEFSWGLGYRLTSDYIDDTPRYMADPASRNDQLINTFLQDKFELIEDELTLTLGSKFEHNDYSGFEIQPSIRMLWSPEEHHRLWGAISRAVRTPSRFEHDVRFPILSSPPMSERNPLPIPVVAYAQGDSGFDSEDLLAYEVGYRYLYSEKFTFDAALFYNQYNRLRSATADVITLSDNGLYAVAPLLADNDMDGETYGVELAADFTPIDWWTWSLTYTWMDIQLHLPHDNPITDVLSDENGTPHHQASLRSSIDIGSDVEFDLWLRYTDKLPTYAVPSYFSLDARLSWSPSDNLELAVGGQNLLSDNHAEFTRSNFFAAMPSEVDRQVYAKVTWKF